MSDVCFVFASAAEKDAEGVIGKYFADADFDIKFLCSGKKEKILKWERNGFRRPIDPSNVEVRKEFVLVLSLVAQVVHLGLKDII